MPNFVDPIRVNNVLLANADGTFVVPTNAIDGQMIDAEVVKVVSVPLTNANIKALGTAIPLVAAPGAGKVIEFLGAVLYHDYGAEVLTGDHAITIGLDAATVAVAAVIPHGDFAHKAADHIYMVKPALAFNATAAASVNKNLAIKAAGNFAGNASNDTVWTVKVIYRVITI